MNWNVLKDEETLETIIEESKGQIVLIFKHSNRCSTSAMAIGRFERNWNEEEMKNIKPYFLDIIRFREVSNKVVGLFGIMHQSPQVLVIKNGKCIYNISHMGINYQDIKKLSDEISVN